MSICKPKLDRFKVLDLILWADDENPNKLQTILPADLHIVRPFDSVFEDNHNRVGGYYECSDGKFRSEFHIKDAGGDKNRTIEGHSLIRVNDARKVKKRSEKNNDEDIIEIDCEVLIEGRYIEEFMSSDMAGSHEDGDKDIEIDVKLNEDSKQISCMKNIKHEDELRQNLWFQAGNQEHTDVIFVFTDGEILHAHKAVLSSQSEVFRTHFLQDPPFEDQHVVNIEDTTKDVFHDFLHYIYRGFTYFYDVKHQLNLLYLATKYFIEDLKHKITHFLKDNFMDFELFSWRPYPMPPLRYFEIFLFQKVSPDTYASLKDAEGWLRENAFYMIHDPDFLDVSFYDIKDFLSLDPPVEVTPNHLLETVITWAVHQKRMLKDIDDEEKIEQLKDIKENVQILIDLIDLKESTLEALKELDLNNIPVEEVIDRPALEREIQRNMNEKYDHDHQQGPCLDEAYICKTTAEISDREFTTCATVDISNILNKDDDQIVYSKKINMISGTAKVTILFQRESKENEVGHNPGFVTVILTSVPSKGQKAEEISAQMDFVIFNLLGKPFWAANYMESGPFHHWMSITTNNRIIKSFKGHNWERMIDSNKKSLTGRSLVHFKLNVVKTRPRV